MQAQNQSGSGVKATTTPRNLLATAMIGAALICYQVHKTPDARTQLESLAMHAQQLGELTESDAAVVAKLLAALQIYIPRTSLSLV